MSEFPTTISEFQDQFVSDEACLRYLEKIRWPEGFSCPNCRHGKYWRTKRGLLQCQECRYQCSVTAGTIFHDTRKPIRLWFEAIWHITNQKYGANALGLQRIFSFGSYNTAWQWLHNEYTFRFNRRSSTSRGKLFYRLIQQAVMVNPVTLDQLKGCCFEKNHDSNTMQDSESGGKLPWP